MTAPPGGLIDYAAVLADLEARLTALNAAIAGVTRLLAEPQTAHHPTKETDPCPSPEQN